MSSKEKFKQIGNTQIVQKRAEGFNNTNNIKSYSMKKVTVEQSIKTSNNIGRSNYLQKNTNQNKITQYQNTSNSSKASNNIIPVINNESKNSYHSNNVKVYEYSSGSTSSKIKSNLSGNLKTNLNANLTHHPNQVNNLIHNHKFYTSNTENTNKTTKTSKTSNTVTSTRTEKSQRIQSLSPVGKTKYVVETKKVEVYGRPRYSSASNSSRETNISISKSQLKKLMTNMWMEENYCSNVESLCCLVDPNSQSNSRRSDYSEKIYEREREQNAIIIKEYEAQIMKLKNILNMKDQEMKKLVQNLKQSENSLKIKNKRLYELNVKTSKKTEELDKDTHELQIISTKQETKKKENLDKDAHSLQIISMKRGWNDTNIPSPVNEIYIETIKHESPVNEKKYEEMRRVMKRKEEEEIIRRKRMEKFEKIKNLEVQEMGILSIITKKPKKNNMCQHLESIMIYSKQKKNPIIVQKIEEINITSHIIKTQNEIQELDGLEIIHYKKNKNLELQQQCLNGLEIQREYDMLLVKPMWNSLKIQGTGLNLLAIPRDIELENQEIDEFEIHGIEKPEKIQLIMPLPENNMVKINNFKIIGKVKMKTDLKIKRERINLIGLPKKEEVDWNTVIKPIKSTKLSLRRLYNKKIEINWNDIIKPIKSTKLYIRGLVKKEVPKILKVVKKDKFNFLHFKKMDEFDIESFDINLFSKQRKLKNTLKTIRNGFNIKGKEEKKITLIKNRMDSINLYGLKKKTVLIPSFNSYVDLHSEELELKNWNDLNKVMRTRDLNIIKKQKKKGENKIIRKVVNVEVKIPQKKIIIKPVKGNKLFIKKTDKEMPEYKYIKTGKLFIKGIKKEIKKPEIILKNIKTGRLIIKGIQKIEEKKPEIILKNIKENKLFIKGLQKIVEKNPEIVLKHIRENRLFIKGFQHVEQKPEVILKQIKTTKLSIKGIKKEIERPKQIVKEIIKESVKKVDWNDLIKVEKKPDINLIHKAKKVVLKKQSLNAFSLKGTQQIQRKESEKFEITYNWSNLLKAQRNAKFGIKGKVKAIIKLSVIKGDKFTIHREPEDEIIYNDDYNYLSQQKKENGKEQSQKENKLVVIKEKEVTPILKREIRAQVIRVKEESSETSSQSEVDVLAGIKKQRMLAIATEKENAKLGYSKKVINGEVIFTPKTALGVNLGGAKYKKEIIAKKGIVINTGNTERLSGIEISGNHGEVYYERLSGIGGAIREGSYKIVNGSNISSTSKLNTQKKLTTMYKSSSNLSKKSLNGPNDSKKKNIKKQFIVKSKMNLESSGNLSTTHMIPTTNSKEGIKKVTSKSNLTTGNMKHCASTMGMRPGSGHIVSMKKESTYTYEHRDNGNIVNKTQQTKVESYENK